MRATRVSCSSVRFFKSIEYFFFSPPPWTSSVVAHSFPWHLSFWSTVLYWIYASSQTRTCFAGGRSISWWRALHGSSFCNIAAAQRTAKPASKSSSLIGLRSEPSEETFLRAWLARTRKGSTNSRTAPTCGKWKRQFFVSLWRLESDFLCGCDWESRGTHREPAAVWRCQMTGFTTKRGCCLMVRWSGPWLVL